VVGVREDVLNAADDLLRGWQDLVTKCEELSGGNSASHRFITVQPRIPTVVDLLCQNELQSSSVPPFHVSRGRWRGRQEKGSFPSCLVCCIVLFVALAACLVALVWPGATLP